MVGLFFMDDDRILFILADGLCGYCGMPYLVTANEFKDDLKPITKDIPEFEDYGQCQDCNIADWKYGGPWHERYDEIL